MKNSKVLTLLVLILAAASFLRLYALGSAPPGLYSDEAVNGNNAVQALSNNEFKSFYSENNGREGLFINIQALALKAFCSDNCRNNGPIFPLRLPSAIFGILTVLGVYLLSKEFFEDERIALLAAFLIAVSFWHVNFSRIAFRAIMAPAFLTWGLYLLLRSFRNSKLEIRNWPLPILAGLVYGLGMHSYIAYRATPLIIVFGLWLLSYKYGRGAVMKIGTVFVVSSIIVFLPLGLYFLQNPADFLGRTSQISVSQSSSPIKDLALNTLKTAGMFNFVGDWNPRHNIPGNPLLYWPVGILFLIGLIVAIRNLFKTSSFGFRILLAWLFVAALPVIISNEGLPHALRAILMAPPVFILAAIGGVRLYDFAVRKLRAPRTILRTTVFVLSALLFLRAGGVYFVEWTQNPATESAFNRDIVEIGREINNLAPEIPKYVVIDTGGHDIRKIGTAAQTLMYITDTYLPEKQKAKNLYYISTEELSEVSQDSYIIKL